jgi:hypothetical protein
MESNARHFIGNVEVDKEDIKNCTTSATKKSGKSISTTMFLDEVLSELFSDCNNTRKKDNKYDEKNWGVLKNNFKGSVFETTEHPLKETKGVKYNDGKLPLDIMLTRQFPKALNAVCQATMFGHNKYKDTDVDFLNFKKVLGGSQTYADALQRHSVDKSVIDLDSGLPHIFHKCWNALAELELWIEENKFAH